MNSVTADNDTNNDMPDDTLDELTLTATCERCGDEVEVEETDEIPDDWQQLADPDELWCERCVDGYAISCDCCGDWLSARRSHDVRRHGDTEYVCGSCYDNNYTECEVCRDVVPNNEIETYSGTTTACNSCWTNSYECNDCDERVWDGDEHDCPEADDDEDEGPIYDYSFNPLNRLDYLGKPKDKLYLGVELEVEVRSGSRSDRTELAEIVAEMMSGFAILKSDGSLDCGFEIVTAPATLAIHREEWEKRFFSRPEVLRRLSSWDAGTCGIHVHISRKPLSPLTQTKMLAFCNAVENKTMLCKLAGRWNSTYAKYQPRNKKSDYLRETTEHYAVLSVSGSKPTLELRMFKGSLRPARIYRAVEFTYSLAKFCEQTGLERLSFERDYLPWLKSEKKRYPALAEFYFPKPVPTLQDEAKRLARKRGLGKRQLMLEGLGVAATTEAAIATTAATPPVAMTALAIGDMGEVSEDVLRRYLELERQEEEAEVVRAEAAERLRRRITTPTQQPITSEADGSDAIPNVMRFATRAERERVLELVPVTDDLVEEVLRRGIDHGTWDYGHEADRRNCREWILSERRLYLDDPRTTGGCGCSGCMMYFNVQQSRYAEAIREERRRIAAEEAAAAEAARTAAMQAASIVASPLRLAIDDWIARWEGAWDGVPANAMIEFFNPPLDATVRDQRPATVELQREELQEVELEPEFVDEMLRRMRVEFPISYGIVTTETMHENLIGIRAQLESLPARCTCIECEIFWQIHNAAVYRIREYQERRNARQWRVNWSWDMYIEERGQMLDRYLGGYIADSTTPYSYRQVRMREIADMYPTSYNDSTDNGTIY